MVSTKNLFRSDHVSTVTPGPLSAAATLLASFWLLSKIMIRLALPPVPVKACALSSGMNTAL